MLFDIDLFDMILFLPVLPHVKQIVFADILLQRTWRKRTIKISGMKKKLQKVPNMTIFTIQDNSQSKDALRIWQ